MDSMDSLMESQSKSNRVKSKIRISPREHHQGWRGWPLKLGTNILQTCLGLSRCRNAYWWMMILRLRLRISKTISLLVLFMKMEWIIHASKAILEASTFSMKIMSTSYSLLEILKIILQMGNTSPKLDSQILSISTTGKMLTTQLKTLDLLSSMPRKAPISFVKVPSRCPMSSQLSPTTSN